MSESSVSVSELRLRDHLRALFVAAHVALITLMALPNPRRINERDLADPALQEVFSDWREVLEAAGVSLTPEETNTLVMSFANQYMDARAVVLDPVRPYFQYTGANQAWQMFGYLNRTPARLSVEVLSQGGEWSTLFLARDPEHDWRRALFDSERMRGMVNHYSWRERRGGFRMLADWVSCEVFLEEPNAKLVRMSMKQVQLPTPDVLRETGRISTRRTYWPEFRYADDCIWIDDSEATE
ncbi:MAG TPA: hypothetical protein DFR83_16200 [Deltaproteobacteria bacterium]|nr:hypothetical protein [Deltaproteobacteria bacterium]